MYLWEYMKIKLIYRGKGNKKEMNNQRDIYITNTCEFLEKIIHARNKKNLTKGISERQNGSMGKRSIDDNLFTLQAIIDDNKNHMRDTYIQFVDAENALIDWLNDACNKLN